jgi:hypothetical protein
MSTRAAKAAPAHAPEAAATRARVLVACQHGQPDDVVELDPEALAQAVAAGQVDPHHDAVAYAASLKD